MMNSVIRRNPISLPLMANKYGVNEPILQFFGQLFAREDLVQIQFVLSILHFKTFIVSNQLFGSLSQTIILMEENHVIDCPTTVAMDTVVFNKLNEPKTGIAKKYKRKRKPYIYQRKRKQIRLQSKPFNVDSTTEEEYDIFSINGHVTDQKTGRTLYVVQWKGFSNKIGSKTLEPEENFIPNGINTLQRYNEFVESNGNPIGDPTLTKACKEFMRSSVTSRSVSDGTHLTRYQTIVDGQNVNLTRDFFKSLTERGFYDHQYGAQSVLLELEGDGPKLELSKDQFEVLIWYQLNQLWKGNTLSICKQILGYNNTNSRICYTSMRKLRSSLGSNYPGISEYICKPNKTVKFILTKGQTKGTNNGKPVVFLIVSNNGGFGSILHAIAAIVTFAESGHCIRYYDPWHCNFKNKFTIILEECVPKLKSNNTRAFYTCGDQSEDSTCLMRVMLFIAEILDGKQLEDFQWTQI